MNIKREFTALHTMKMAVPGNNSFTTKISDEKKEININISGQIGEDVDQIKELILDALNDTSVSRDRHKKIVALYEEMVERKDQKIKELTRIIQDRAK
jgi:hypothetical protein